MGGGKMVNEVKNGELIKMKNKWGCIMRGMERNGRKVRVGNPRRVDFQKGRDKGSGAVGHI